MKVVINDKIGGFGLSKLAYQKLIEKGWIIGIDLFEDDNTFLEREYGKYSFYYDKGNRSEKYYRTHKDVINIVEELGSLSWGPHASLKIIEIPDDIEWEIHGNGVEWVAEKHRCWS